MRVTLLHNPNAGAEELDRKRLLELLEDAGYTPTYHSTRRNEWKRSLEDPGDLVIVAGGDGTVAKVARRLAGRGAPLAILPLGTANNIAASLGITGPPEEIVARWVWTRPVATDLALAIGPWGNRYIVEGLGVGVLPRMFEESAVRVPKNSTPVDDQIRLNIELLLEVLDESRPWPLDVELDGHDLSGDHLMLEAMNIRAIGPRLDLAPDADPGDGMLDIVLVREADRDALTCFLRRGLGDPCSSPPLTQVRGRHLRVGCGRAGVHLDDKTWKDGKSPVAFEVRVVAGAIEVLR